MRFPAELEQQVLQALAAQPDAHLRFRPEAYREDGTIVIYRDNLAKTLHRYLWERVVGPLPRGRFLHRQCKARGCVNPRHYVESARAQKTKPKRCPNDHEYTRANTRVDPRGKRHCRTCERAARRRANPNPRPVAGYCRKGLHGALTAENSYTVTDRRTGRVHRKCKPCHLKRMADYRKEQAA